MIKVKLLLDVISDLRSLADSLQGVANGMLENEVPGATDEMIKGEVPGASNGMVKNEVLEAANVMTENETSAAVATTKQEVMKKEKHTSKEVVKKEKKPSKKAATKKQYTLEEVRGILAEKSQNGLTTEVKTLIEKYGGNKLSDINPENYEAMIKEAKVLGSE